MAQYKLKFMFDWGSGVCVWSADLATEEHLGSYPIETSHLPISRELVNLLNELIILYDTALNWDDPRSALLWDKTQQILFEEKANFAYKQLCVELGSDYEVSLYPYFRI